MKREIIELRKCMADEGIDAYFVPSGDFHGSEYVNEFFRTREFLSGFTGSAGELIVTADGAWLWTDGRYFLQAADQLSGSGIELMKMGEEGVPKTHEFLLSLVEQSNKENPEKKYVIGFDGRVVTAAFGKTLKEKLGGDDHSVEFRLGQDLGGKVWQDRPAIRPTAVWELPLSSAGVDTKDKIAAIREKMKEEGRTVLSGKNRRSSAVPGRRYGVQRRV